MHGVTTVKKSRCTIFPDGFRLRRWVVLLFSCLVLFTPAYAQSQPASGKKPQVKLIYGALTAANGPLWLAADEGLFEKHGLDVQMVHGRGATPIQATISGAVEFGHYAGVQVIAANLSGSDLVFIAAQSNYAVLSIWTKRDSPVKSLAELSGKTIGVGAPGSATHTNTRLALRKAGVAERDVKYIHHGSLPEIFVSLDKGLVDAGVASAPRPGFHELVDLASQKIPFLQGAIVVRRAYLQAQRPVVLSFVKAFVQSMKLINERPEAIVGSLAKHLRVRPEIAKEAYRSFAHVWEDVPYVRAESVQTILDLHAREAVKDITPEKYIENGLIKELEATGFIKGLYRK
jgi:ABC-type nitrate/sulfonate/bicarbonate transport system substrate-binding protein